MMLKEGLAPTPVDSTPAKRKRSSTFRPGLAKILLVAVLLGTGVAVVTEGVPEVIGAEAATVDAANVSGWSSKPLFYGASSGSGVVGYSYAGAPVTMYCWLDAGWYAGTNRWFLVHTYVWSSLTRRWVWASGYMSANHVKNQSSVRHC